MLTAKTSIAGDNWSSGNLLVTLPSGVKASVIDFQPVPYDTSTDFNVELIEVYPTGNPPNINYTATGVLLKTRSEFPVVNMRTYNTSLLGSELRARASGQCEIIMNYVHVTRPLTDWYGINAGLENGKLW